MGGARLVPSCARPCRTRSREPSPRACRRSRSPASARCPTCRRRTTGSSATWPSTSGSPSAARASTWWTWPAARATARTCSRAARARVTGVDANPEAHEHARAQVHAPGRALRARPRGDYRSPATPSSSCRRSSTSRNPRRCSSTSARSAAGRDRLRLDAERAHARARRAPRSPATRGTCKEYRAEEFRALCECVFDRVELLGLFHARKLRAHELAMRAGWDRVHPRSASRSPSTTGSRRRSPRATSRCGPGRSTARSTSSRCCDEPRDRGRARARPALAHALRRGLRHLAVRRGVAVGGGRQRLPAAARGARRRARDGRPHAGAVRPARGDAGRGGRALPALPARHPRADPRRGRARPRRRRRARAGGGAPPRGGRLRARASALSRSAAATCSRAFARPRRVELWTSSATHAVLPLLATDAGLRLQLATGVASHERRFGAWSRRLLAARVRLRAGARARPGRRTACAPSASTRPSVDGLSTSSSRWPPRRARWRCRSTGRPSSSSGRRDTATRRTARYRDYHGRTAHDLRPWNNAGEPYDHEAALALAREHARDFVSARRAAAARADGGLLCCALDTELLGHWWYEGPAGSRAVLEEARARRAAARDACPRGSSGSSRSSASWRPRPGGRARTCPPGTRRRGRARLRGARRRAADGGRRGGPRDAARGARARRARAARAAVERLGLPGHARPGRRLPARAPAPARARRSTLRWPL